MKKTILSAVLLCVILLTAGCKKENWTDWKVQNEAWLAKNKTAEGVLTTPTGLQYKVLRQGIAGTKPDVLKSVRIRYTGRLITGHVFEENEAADFAVSGVIEGLAEGLKKMNKSGHYIFYIPQELGYKAEEQGTRGNASYIPPYSTLIFDVELNDVY
ncbi:MAG: FKBP-type peptidyl-prolyl cis-trans isomerase [Paludibacteraceae bacterium]|nr:FKBP-type peptidyl-prolyl cis-trans isomerase [Paludibacteraceae bacterium]